MEPTQLSYIAGIIDGEGSISIIRQVHTAHSAYYSYFGRVQVGMTDKIIPAWLQAEFGGELHLRKPSNPNWKERWDWTVNCQKALDFLEQVLPYLKIKKGQAELVVEFQKNRPNGLHRTEFQKEDDAIIYDMCRGLNRRGVKNLVLQRSN